MDGRVGDHEDAMLDVVEGQNRVEQHERSVVRIVRCAPVVPLPPIVQRRFKPGGRLVTQEANGATGETRQSLHAR